MTNLTLAEAIKFLQDLQATGREANWLPVFVYNTALCGDSATHVAIRNAVDEAQRMKYEEENRFMRLVMDMTGFYIKTLENKPSDPFAEVVKAVTSVWVMNGYHGFHATRDLALASIRRALSGNDPAKVMREWVQESQRNYLATAYKSEAITAIKWRAMYDDLATRLEKSATPTLPKMRPICKRDHHITMEEFRAGVECCAYTDDDGYGDFATATEVSDLPLYASKLATTEIPEWATHLVWYNK